MKTPRRKTIAVDFDGVIHGYSKGWHDGSCYDPPLPNALESLRQLLTKYYVVVFTVRDPNQVSAYLEHRGFLTQVENLTFWNTENVILVTSQKPAAVLYLDDRGLRFESWEQAMSDIDRILEDSK